jgi:hypothetical protein
MKSEKKMHSENYGIWSYGGLEEDIHTHTHTYIYSEREREREKEER